jgi:hypothetical protein
MSFSSVSISPHVSSGYEHFLFGEFPSVPNSSTRPFPSPSSLHSIRSRLRTVESSINSLTKERNSLIKQLQQVETQSGFHSEIPESEVNNACQCKCTCNQCSPPVVPSSSSPSLSIFSSPVCPSFSSYSDSELSCLLSSFACKIRSRQLNIQRLQEIWCEQQEQRKMKEASLNKTIDNESKQSEWERTREFVRGSSALYTSVLLMQPMDGEQFQQAIKTLGAQQINKEKLKNWAEQEGISLAYTKSNQNK